MKEPLKTLGIEKLEFDAKGRVWWTCYEGGEKQERCLGREHTPEEMEDLAQWAKRRGMVLPPQLACLKLPRRDKEWGNIV
jgi:hypothetical protein